MGSTSIDSDFEDLLSCFTTHGVRFLVVGGYAVGCHGLPRATKDLDVWVDPEPENARNAWSALAEFGMPLGDIRPSDLATPGPWLQFGRPPKRIDVLTRIDGIDFAGAWARRDMRKMGRNDVPVLSMDDLIRNKTAVGRPQDVADVARLRSLREGGDGAGRVSEPPAPDPAAKRPRRRKPGPTGRARR